MSPSDLPRSSRLSTNVLLLQRSGSFSILLFTSIGSFIYPTLPGGIKAALTASEFVLLCGGLGLTLHRVVEWVWRIVLGDLFVELADGLRAFVRTAKIERYVQKGVFSPEEAANLLKRVAVQDIFPEDLEDAAKRPLPKPRP